MVPCRQAAPGESSASPSPPLTTKKWSSVVDDNNSVSEFHPSVEQIDGAASITVPAEITDKPTPLWRCFIQGHFIGPAPHIGIVHAIVNKLWSSTGQKKRIDVQFLNSSTVLFKIEDDAVRSKVLKRNHWHIAEVPLVVYDWNPENAHRKLDLKSIPLWVDLKGVPGKLFSTKGLSYIASALGKPLKLHHKTEKCLRLDVARILVEVDLTKPLLDMLNVKTSDGTDYCIHVAYPWVPPKCLKCDAWGHEEKSCSESALPYDSKPAADVSEPAPTVLEVEKQVPTQTPPKGISGNSPSLRVQNGKAFYSEVVLSPLPNSSKKELSASLAPENLASKTSEWTVVKRSSRSQSPPPLIEQSVQKTSTSPSRFLALSTVREEGKIEEEDYEAEEVLTVMYKDPDHQRKHNSRGRSSKNPKKPLVSKKDISNSASSTQPPKKASIRKH